MNAVGVFPHPGDHAVGVFVAVCGSTALSGRLEWGAGWRGQQFYGEVEEWWYPLNGPDQMVSTSLA